MKLIIILSFLSLSVFSFDKIIDADEGEQVVVMRGSDGSDGSDGWCTDDDSDSGDRGGDGQDAGNLLISGWFHLTS